MARAGLPPFQLILCGAAFVAISSTAEALPVWPHEQAEAFATCSGRMSALTTHQKANQHPAAAGNAAMTETFDLMLEAVLPIALPEEDGPQVATLWRARGWSEIAALLADVAYSDDTRRAARATDMIAARIKDCTDMVL